MKWRIEKRKMDKAVKQKNKSMKISSNALDDKIDKFTSFRFS